MTVVNELKALLLTINDAKEVDLNEKSLRKLLEKTRAFLVKSKKTENVGCTQQEIQHRWYENNKEYHINKVIERQTKIKRGDETDEDRLKREQMEIEKLNKRAQKLKLQEERLKKQAERLNKRTNFLNKQKKKLITTQ